MLKDPDFVCAAQRRPKIDVYFKAVERDQNCGETNTEDQRVGGVLANGSMLDFRDLNRAKSSILTQARLPIVCSLDTAAALPLANPVNAICGVQQAT